MSTAAEKERYQEYLCSPEWFALRNAVMSRCRGKCEKCFCADAEQVHHKTYIRIYRESISDLIAVCDACNEKIHKPKRLISEAEDRVRDIERRRIRTPLESFYSSWPLQLYRRESKSLGLDEEFGDAVDSVVSQLAGLEDGVVSMRQVLEAKLALVQIHRTIDRLQGLGSQIPKVIS